MALAVLGLSAFGSCGSAGGATRAPAAHPAPIVEGAPAGLDLHAHLFFYDGTGIPLYSGFAAPATVESWHERIGPKVDAASLNASGMTVVVAALYAHPLFWLSERDSIRAQIAAAEKFLASDPGWGLARDAREARKLLAAGRKALIFSIEGASGILENEADLREFIDEKGVSLVTPLHFTDDEFGGAAFMPGINGIASPWAWLVSLFQPVRDAQGERVNPQGLRARGEWLIRRLAARGVWIDLAHASDASQADIRRLAAQQPPLYTHMMLRKYYHAERGISDLQLSAVAVGDGMVGLLPSEDTLKNTEIRPALCPVACPSCQGQGGVPAWREQFEEMAAVIGRGRLGMGSDINAPLKLLKPECGEARGFDQYRDLARLNRILIEREGYRPAEVRERFLALWEKVRPVP